MEVLSLGARFKAKKHCCPTDKNSYSINTFFPAAIHLARGFKNVSTALSVMDHRTRSLSHSMGKNKSWILGRGEEAVPEAQNLPFSSSGVCSRSHTRRSLGEEQMQAVPGTLSPRGSAG